MPRKATKTEPKILEVQGVPTAEGLIAKGREYARPTQGGILITDLGHATIGAALRRKAAVRIALGDSEWEQPPSRTDIGGNRS